MRTPYKKKSNEIISNFDRGFTLIELLVTVVILMLVMIAVYSLFDQGTWLYLKSEQQTESQESLRLSMEQMERDIRMAGSLVPAGVEVSGTAMWTPFIFNGSISKLYFYGDVDSRNTILKTDASSSTITIDGVPSVVCPSPGTSKLVLARRYSAWQPFTCNSIDDGARTITLSGAPSGFTAADSAVLTPDTVFYQLSNDIDANGNCDINTYPFCTLQRGEIMGNDPTAQTAANLQNIAFHITKLNFEYFDGGGDTLATPLTGADLSAAQQIRITLTANYRSTRAGGNATAGSAVYETAQLISTVLVRDARY